MSKLEEGEKLLQENLSLNMQRHCFAVGAIMEGLAEHFGEDREKWFLSGILHDIDYEQTEKDLSQHSKLAAQWLEEKGFDPEVVRAVLVHNEAHGLPLNTRMERCLILADALSGLVIASTLVLPSKKIIDLQVPSVVKKFKQKGFAAGVHREDIMRCEQEGLSLDRFIGIAIQNMQKHADKLGLS